MTLQELLDKQPKNQAEAMLLDALIALLETGWASKKSLNEIFDSLEKSAQRWLST